MLHLDRRPHEAIIIDIGGRIVTITAWPIPRGQVKLAIRAPRDIPIVRQELVQKSRKKQGSSSPIRL